MRALTSLSISATLLVGCASSGTAEAELRDAVLSKYGGDPGCVAEAVARVEAEDRRNLLAMVQGEPVSGVEFTPETEDAISDILRC